MPDAAANFCEECGAPLAPPPAAAGAALRTDCPGCGSVASAEDGFCPACGLERVPASGARDHFEEARGNVLAAVSDLGRRHARNEDFFALAAAGDDGAGRVLIAVVCDGISHSQRPDEAAAAAARAAVASLSAATPERLAADPPARLREAVAQAQAAIVALPPPAVVPVGDDGKPLDAPASTLVAALVRGRELDLVWLGDSRGYFIAGTTPSPAVPLTHDHTWFNAIVDAGRMSAEEASRSPNAHTVLRSLGGPSPNGAAGDEPSVGHFTAPEDGWLLLCSDGLWNYARDPATVGRLMRAAVGDALAAADPQPLRRAARSLVDFALRAGGRDNVTVALTRIQG